MIIRIQPQWYSSKAASDQKIRETLAHRRAGAVRVDVQHLPRAIDDHPELNHLARPKHTVEMRHDFGIGDVGSGCSSTAFRVHAGQICDCHGHIGYHAITHCDAFHLADTLSFPGSTKQSADRRVGFFHCETERIDAVAIDQCVGRSGIDHQRAGPVVYGNRDEQMITIASL